MLTQEDRVVAQKLTRKHKKPSQKKGKSKPTRDSIKRQIIESAKKMVDGTTHRRAPQEKTLYTHCYATGLDVDASKLFYIPLKKVHNVTSNMSPAEYRHKLALAGQFISPVAALLFLRNNPHIDTNGELYDNVCHYYKVDSAFEESRLEQLRAIATQPESVERNAAYEALVQPTTSNLFRISGAVEYKVTRPKQSGSKRPRSEDSDAQGSAKRQKKSGKHADGDIASSIEDALTAASDDVSE